MLCTLLFHNCYVKADELKSLRKNAILQKKKQQNYGILCPQK